MFNCTLVPEHIAKKEVLCVKDVMLIAWLKNAV